jgi:hypothetical protein
VFGGISKMALAALRLALRIALVTSCAVTMGMFSFGIVDEKLPSRIFFFIWSTFSSKDSSSVSVTLWSSLFAAPSLRSLTSLVTASDSRWWDCDWRVRLSELMFSKFRWKGSAISKCRTILLLDTDLGRKR